MKKYILTLVVAAAFSVTSAQAVVIDDFNGGAQTVVADGSDGIAYAGAIGGYREVYIESNNPPHAVADVLPSPGHFSLATDAGADAFSLITWGGTAGSGLGGVDLVGGLVDNAFTLDIVASDHLAEYILRVTDTNGYQESIGESLNGPGAMSWQFDMFTIVDLTTVDTIALSVATQPGGDVVFDSFLTSGQVSPPQAPEPTTLALLGLGLAGIGFGRRKVKAKLKG